MRKDDELAERTKQFALRVMRRFEQLPPAIAAQTVGRRVLRSGTSVAANCREARRSRRRAEVRAKLGVVAQELDEPKLWLELLVRSRALSASSMNSGETGR